MTTCFQPCSSGPESDIHQPELGSLSPVHPFRTGQTLSDAALVGRSTYYPDYGRSCEILLQAYDLIDGANADAIRMERALSSLQTDPESATTPNVDPAAEQPYRAASSPRPTAVVSPVEYIRTTSADDGRPLKATATTPQTERTPGGPDSVPVASGRLTGSGLAAVKVEGISMEGAGIKDGDYVIVDTAASQGWRRSRRYNGRARRP